MALLSQTQKEYYNSGNSSNYGDYQFVSLDSIINGFMVAYVGESKLISKVSRTDVQFYGMRAVQEFSYDIFRSVKSQEVEVPNTLKMVLPQDYVNYVKLTTSGNDGVKRNLYPTGKTSNPFAISQDESGTYQFTDGIVEGYRKIKINVPAGNAIQDGDHINLVYEDVNGSWDGGINIVFDNDNDSIDKDYPDGSNVSPRITISYTNTSSVTMVENAIVYNLNALSDFEAVRNANGGVDVLYKNANVHSIAPYGFTESHKDGDGLTQTRTSSEVIDSIYSSTLTPQSESNTWEAYKSHIPIDYRGDDYEGEHFVVGNTGGRYGLDPQHSHDNGTFYIDYSNGFIHFGSALAGKTIVLDYISDGLGSDGEMVVHKFAEEAVYKWIAYGVISSRSNIPEYIVQRFKKERFAEARKAKIRLSNIKIEEFTQVLKGLSKPIK
jgi:hypothetical protein